MKLGHGRWLPTSKRTKPRVATVHGLHAVQRARTTSQVPADRRVKPPLQAKTTRKAEEAMAKAGTKRKAGGKEVEARSKPVVKPKAKARTKAKASDRGDGTPTDGRVSM